MAAPGSYLTLGTEENNRIVGYSLAQLPQDDTYVYLAFKLGNGDGGKNRWFGRGRKASDPRSSDTLSQLTLNLKAEWEKHFPETLPHHPTIKGEWLLLHRIPLATLNPKTPVVERSKLKTIILQKLLQVFVIAEKLRDDSLEGNELQQNEALENTKTPPTMKQPLNQILYGPPGTGKTYHTKARAVGIIEGLSDEDVDNIYKREEISSRFEEYRKTGQVEFVTFHQSFGYEDFVEGIKPLKPDGATQVHYDVIQGVFKRLCQVALSNTSDSSENITTNEDEPDSLDFDSTFDALVKEFANTISKGKKVEVITATGRKFIIYAVNENLIWYRHTDLKNHHVTRKGLENFFRYYHNESEEEAGAKFQSKAKKAIMELLINLNDKKKKANTASKNKATITVTTAPRFVLIIDEINRGNVANIFGELITLLEDDKRAGRPEALTVKLPYSKEDFTVPENLYLLGTMNTADCSVEALDTALRRRFSFTEMRPDAQVLRDNVGMVEGVDVAKILEALNSRLEQLLDRDHCLGHALLLRVQSLDDLRAAFQRNIVPLLQEYFFGDWGKIGLVLGERFISVSQKADGRYALARFGGYDAAGLRERPLYHLADVSKLEAKDFQGIYATT